MKPKEYHQRLAYLEAYLARAFQGLHARIGRGFQTLRSQRPSPPAPLADPLPELETRLEQHLDQVLARHRQAWERAMAGGLPPQLAQLLRTVRRTIHLLMILFILSILALGCLSWFTHRALLARTPTAFQIEMMRKGFEAHRQENPPK